MSSEKNEKIVDDFLTEDKPISGQKYVCMSFLTPEKILKQKQNFFFEEFLKYYDFETSIKKFTQFINFLSPTSKLSLNLKLISSMALEGSQTLFLTKVLTSFFLYSI